MTLKQFSVAIEPIVWFWGRRHFPRSERSITRPSITWMEKRPSHAVLFGAYFGFLHDPACMFARMTQVLKCDSLAFLPHWRSSGHRRSWPQHAFSICLFQSHEWGPQSLNINMNIRKAKLKTHTMKWNSLLPAKVACGADFRQSWNDMEWHRQRTSNNQTSLKHLRQEHAHQRKVDGVTQMFQDLGSQVLNCKLSRLGGMESQKEVAYMPSLEKNVKFQTAEQ